MVDSPQIVQLGFQAPIPAFPQRGGGPPWILIRVGDWRVIYSIDDRRRVWSMCSMFLIEVRPTSDLDRGSSRNWQSPEGVLSVHVNDRLTIIGKDWCVLSGSSSEQVEGKEVDHRVTSDGKTLAAVQS
jgi:hypothetical protein